ncbi:MAG: helix-turn-helix transcriptional regulator [Firmicutes bacterium]|nr:helix-turn-helix transcriptional regulator [Bacillota bacterium]
MELPVLMRQFAAASGLSVVIAKDSRIFAVMKNYQDDHGLCQALLSSLPKSLPHAWTFVTPEGVLGGGIDVPAHDRTLILMPLFAFECTLQTARRLVHRLSLPDSAASGLQREMNLSSPCDMKKLQNYLRFLNHLLNDQVECEIQTLDFHWAPAFRSHYAPSAPVIRDEGEDLEGEIVRLIRGGKEKELVRYFNEKLFLYDSPVRLDNLRQEQRYLFGANMYMSRIAVQEGVSLDLVNQLADMYGERIEAVFSREDFNHIFLEFSLRYTRLIAELRKDASSSPLVTRLGRYVQAHLYEPVSLATAAEDLGYSKSYLCTEFKKATGETVTHYIQKSKIREASLLLSEHRMQVTEVSEALGFSDPGYFIKVYRKFTGHTPGHLPVSVVLDQDQYQHADQHD